MRIGILLYRYKWFNMEAMDVINIVMIVKFVMIPFLDKIYDRNINIVVKKIMFNKEKNYVRLKYRERIRIRFFVLILELF